MEIISKLSFYSVALVYNVCLVIGVQTVSINTVQKKKQNESPYSCSKSVTLGAKNFFEKENIYCKYSKYRDR